MYLFGSLHQTLRITISVKMYYVKMPELEIDPIKVQSKLARFNERAANSLHLKCKSRVQRTYFSFDLLAKSMKLNALF